MKKKAINAVYRKNSESFPDWLKYEVTILSEDGEISKVPAYGKDLQDALSRVVHDDRVKKIEKKVIGKVSLTGWAIAWFLGMALSVSVVYSTIEHKYAGYWIIGVILLYAFMTLSISNWFRLRNVSQNKK